MTSRLPAIRRGTLVAVLLAGTLALGLGACGRRGQPEPPPDPNAPAKTQPDRSAPPRARAGASSSAGSTAQPAPTTLATRPGAVTENSLDDDDAPDDPNAGVSPQPTPAPSNRRRGRAYQVPKEPFFLDPIL